MATVSRKRKTSASKSKKRPRRRTKAKSPKVYIPAGKIILFCGCVVVFCTILLILAQAFSGKSSSAAGSKGGASTADSRSDKSHSDASKGGVTVQSPQYAERYSSSEKTSASGSASATSGRASGSSSASSSGAASSTANSSLARVSTSSATTTSSGSSGSATTTSSSTTSASSKNNFSSLPEAVGSPLLVFLFDDGGQNMNQLEPFVSLPFPVTVAVLPKLPHSKEAGARVRRSGNELILHQPMQAVNLNVNPGAGAILPSMNEDDIRAVLFENILEVGPVTGLNNHEGSLITADAEKMSWIMKFASDEGLYFLDSRTNVETKVPYVAAALGYSYYQRNVFLDNTKNREDILREIQKGLEFANKNGSVIMIGHVWSADVLPSLLTELYPVLKSKGYRFGTVSSSPLRR